MKKLVVLVTAFVAGSVIVAPSAFANPKTVVEEVGMPASGSCADVDDSALGYGTGVSGHWHPGFAMWLNGGKGGAICGRSLVYSSSSKGWTFGS